MCSQHDAHFKGLDSVLWPAASQLSRSTPDRHVPLFHYVPHHATDTLHHFAVRFVNLRPRDATRTQDRKHIPPAHGLHLSSFTEFTARARCLHHLAHPKSELRICILLLTSATESSTKRDRLGLQNNSAANTAFGPRTSPHIPSSCHRSQFNPCLNQLFRELGRNLGHVVLGGIPWHHFFNLGSCAQDRSARGAFHSFLRSVPTLELHSFPR